MILKVVIDEKVKPIIIKDVGDIVRRIATFRKQI